MTDTATPQPPRHRAAPRLVPNAVMHLATFVAIVSLLLPTSWWSRAMSGLALTVMAAFFVQRWRRAGYDMTVGATQELEPR